ncbi:calcium:proton antiporter [Chenggangzhangella methanolivorans]|uniref:Ionic transporter n=1 Tax=Chenggangzhangella methanolivorans TaxID=1437009 RepID=A0A9E6R756_9HYPH|nr:ionic transporter [Chenggangzhangella methanolivorans]QZN98529.1 ionic transporter [Chenggangzhangella methanolivorans]
MTTRAQSAMFYGAPVAALLVGAALAIFDLHDAVHSLPLTILVYVFAAGMLFFTVFLVLHHAESVAHRIGEPYGTLLLTVAVTSIEVSIIVSLMLQGKNNPTLARESVFSTVMIVTSGLVGACLVLGSWRHRHQEFKRQGTSALLSVLAALSILTLVLPNYTLTTAPGTFSAAQLGFVSVLAVLLYAGFVFAQTIGHRDDFVEDLVARPEHAHHPARQTNIVVSLVMLFAGLIGVVLLAEHVASGVEHGLVALQVGQVDAIIGALIAALVLLPEGVSAIRAAWRNELQRSINIALGSACATIGLTIPTVAVVSMIAGRELTLGLGQGDSVLLFLTLAVSVISFGTGRTIVLTGLVHLVVFVAYLMLIVVP